MKLGPPRFWKHATLNWPLRLLTPASWLFGGGARIVALCAKPETVSVPVLCCGNLTVGGAGKTILVETLAERLRGMGHTPHILSRGYGGKMRGPVRVDMARHRPADVGDEPFMLARHTPVWIGANRATIAHLAIAEGADCLIMDDGLQNHSLHQDCKIVTIDGASGFGNGKVLPLGPLREPLAPALARCDMAVLIGEDDADILSHIPASLPVLHARLIPGPEIRRLQGKQLVAFAGIGRPEKFFEMLGNAGLNLIRRLPFPDHHPYTERDCRRLIALGRQTGVRLVTTPKDAVKLPEWFRKEVAVISVELRWENPAGLDLMLAGLWTSA